MPRRAHVVLEGSAGSWQVSVPLPVGVPHTAEMPCNDQRNDIGPRELVAHSSFQQCGPAPGMTNSVLEGVNPARCCDDFFGVFRKCVCVRSHARSYHQAHHVVVKVKEGDCLSELRDLVVFSPIHLTDARAAAVHWLAGRLQPNVHEETWRGMGAPPPRCEEAHISNLDCDVLPFNVDRDSSDRPTHRRLAVDLHLGCARGIPAGRY